MNDKLVSSTLALSMLMGTVVAGGTAVYAKDKNVKIQLHKEFDTPTYMGEKWKAPKGLSKNEVVFAYLKDKSKLLKLKGDMKDNFEIRKAEADEETNTYHVRLIEKYKGIPVYGSDQAIALDEDDNVTSFFGQVIPDLDKKKISTKAKIKEKDAIKTVKKDIEDEVGDVENYDKEPSAELLIYPHDDGKYDLAYLVKASFSVPEAGYWHYFINATNGKIIDKFNATDEATGSGTGVLGDTKSFETYYYSGKYYMYGISRVDGIETYNAKNAPYYSTTLPGSWVTSTNNYFTDAAAVDAHAYAEKVYDYFKNTHGRNSYDNAGAAIVSSVHVGSNWNNAAWIGTQMVYGDGDGSTFRPLSGALDVVGHELTHAVTENTAGLIYQNESGALNESISDIFGAMVDSNDWLMGEDIYTPGISGDALRSMSDPASVGDPDHYSNRYTGTQDNGGVHTNSSINNKAAYLMSDGGTHYGVTVTGIGRSATEKIYYRALTYYLTASSNFSQMRQAAVQAATDLYGATSQEVATVKKAYDAVGVN